MKKIFNYQNIYLSLIAIILISIGNYFHYNSPKKSFELSKQDTAINIDHKLLNIFSAGQNRLIADLIWISTLLDSDNEHYKKKDLNSWMFLRFLSISKLDPKFLKNYQFGGQYLNIIKDDILGAKIIFEKGLSLYPKDYQLNFNAAFLYAFELKEFKRAIELYDYLISTGKAPSYLVSLVNKLKYAQTNDLELALELVQASLSETQKDSSIYNKLLYDYYSIKATIDLECLNNRKTNCNNTDADGYPYVFKDGEYQARKEFSEYKLNIRGDNSPPENDD